MNQLISKLIRTFLLAAIFVICFAPAGEAQDNGELLRAEKDHAVIAARNGDFMTSFRMFNRLLEQYPDNQSLLGDYVTVLSWHGDFAKASDYADKLDISAQPEYALSAAANSLRKNNQLFDAVHFYEASLKQYPDSIPLNAGYSMTLTDVGYLNQSSSALQKFTTSSDRDIVNARNYLASRLIKAEQENAVLLARNGNYHQAGEILDRLYATYPSNQQLLHDYVTVYTWAGEYKKAADASKAMDIEDAPVYAAAAKAESLRKSAQFQQAYDAYKAGYAKYPSYPPIAIGYAIITAEIKSPDEGQDILNKFVEVNPKVARKEVAAADRYILTLGAKGNIAIRAYSDPNMKTIYENNKLLESHPGDSEASHNIIMALSDIGASIAATDMSLDVPNALNTEEENLLLARYYSKLVKWAQQTSYSDPSRLTMLDNAINGFDMLLENKACKASDNCTNTVRSYRVMALTELNRNNEAIAEYEALDNKSVKQTNEVHFAAAQAYSNNYQPKNAQHIYADIISDPATKDEEMISAHSGLFWAYMDDYNYSEALKVTDYFKERYYIDVQDCKSSLLSNMIPADYSYSDGESADLLIGQGILNTGNTACAETYFRHITQEAPGNHFAQAALAVTQDTRGLPLSALETINLAQISDEYSPYYDYLETNFYMDTRQWEKAENQLITLEREQQGYPSLVNLRQKWDIHDAFELQAYANTVFSNANSDVENVYHLDPSLNVYLYSKPLFYNWRVFAGYRYATGNFPEIKAFQNVYILGVDYRAKNFEGALSGNYDDLNTRDFVGGQFDGTVHFNDHWHMPLGISFNAPETTLRALVNDVDATRTYLRLQYYHNDYTQVEGGAAYTHFTDPNNRLELDASLAQRIFTKNTQTLTLKLLGYGMWNDNDETGPYFSPERLLTGDLGLEYTGLIFGRHNLSLSHRANATIGFADQLNYGTYLVYALGYFHSWNFFEDRFLLDYGYEFVSPVYDGDREMNHHLFIGIVWRFG